MFDFVKKQHLIEAQSQISQLQAYVDAVARSSAFVEFSPNGIITHANDTFLKAVGYSLSEVVGKHHRILMQHDDAETSNYALFWTELAKGNFKKGRFERKHKNGTMVYLEASYNPIFDEQKRVVKVVKIATDITQSHQLELKQEGLTKAIDRSMAMIEFDLHGNIIHANENFLKTVGYGMSDVVGKHHRMFMPTNYNQSDYADFWSSLASGKYFTGTFERKDKRGQTIWLEASYNPVFNQRGQVEKIVKFATDVSRSKSLTELKCFSTEVNQSLNALASGNLANVKPVHAIKGGMFESLSIEIANALSNLVHKLSQMCVDVHSASSELHCMSNEVNNASSQMLSRISKLSSYIEETSSAMTEINSVVSNNETNANAASELVCKVQKDASSGAHVIEETIKAMHLIHESSHKIKDIVALIDGIAFQTNLLALNAAVEAARAGEHGRGFAVVASEVRALAGKSADAAKDIKSLIEASVERIDSGTQLADKSGEVLGGVVNSISEVNGLMQSIASASKEQTSALNQIASAIEDIDRISQENASLAQTSASSAEQLLSSANHLDDVIDFFKPEFIQ